jgi:DNA-binding transcriptional MocR family regulator
MCGTSQGNCKTDVRSCKNITSDQIVITNGCQEALFLWLWAATKPGDLVVIESPTFPGIFPLLEDLKLKAIEVPTYPEGGIDLKSLALRLLPIFIPNFNHLNY